MSRNAKLRATSADFCLKGWISGWYPMVKLVTKCPMNWTFKKYSYSIQFWPNNQSHQATAIVRWLTLFRNLFGWNSSVCVSVCQLFWIVGAEKSNQIGVWFHSPFTYLLTTLHKKVPNLDSKKRGSPGFWIQKTGLNSISYKLWTRRQFRPPFRTNLQHCDDQVSASLRIEDMIRKWLPSTIHARYLLTGQYAECRIRNVDRQTL